MTGSDGNGGYVAVHEARSTNTLESTEQACYYY